MFIQMRIFDLPTHVSNCKSDIGQVDVCGVAGRGKHSLLFLQNAQAPSFKQASHDVLVALAQSSPTMLHTPLIRTVEINRTKRKLFI